MGLVSSSENYQKLNTYDNFQIIHIIVILTKEKGYLMRETVYSIVINLLVIIFFIIKKFSIF